MSKKPVLLCIMDGFGWVPNETYGNAVVAAKTPSGCSDGKISHDHHRGLRHGCRPARWSDGQL